MEIEELLGMLGKIDTARLRSQIKTLREEREGLYSFCHVKEGDRAVLTRGYHQDESLTPGNAYGPDDSLRAGATGVIHEMKWMGAKGKPPFRFVAMWEPDLKWGTYTSRMGEDPTPPELLSEVHNTYVRSTGSTYFISADRLKTCEEPYPWVVACRQCGWEGPPPPSAEDSRNRDCPVCKAHYMKGTGKTLLYVACPYPDYVSPELASE